MSSSSQTVTMQPDTRIALVTGADRGIGLEMCRQLAAENYLVVGTSKDAVNAQELNDLAKESQNKIFVQQLDQTKEDEIKNLTEALRTRNYRLDLLVLNAGVAEKEHPNVNACDIDRKELLHMFDVNVAGTASIMKHMLPLVLESHEKKVIGITSKMGSIEEAIGDKPYISAPYRITKAAENMLFRVWARDPAAKDATFLLVHPGHVKTQMGESGSREAPMGVEDGVRQTLQNVIMRCGRQDSGHFYNYDGTELSF